MFPEKYQKALENLKAFLQDAAGSKLPPLLPEPKAKERARFPFWGIHKDPEKLAFGKAYGYGDFNDGRVHSAIKGLPEADRTTHFYAVGATGWGKSTLLESMILQDIIYKRSFGVIDPTGDLIKPIKGWLYYWGPDSLQDDIVLLDLADPVNTLTFNPLEQIKGYSIEEMALQLVEVFQKIWGDSCGPRMGGIMRNSLIALAENNLTLLELPIFLTNTTVRARLLQNVKSPTCRQQFEHFNGVGMRLWNEWIESTLNKVDAFISNPRIRHILAAPKSSFNLREIMDNGKILLVNLDKTKLSEGSALVGAMLVNKIQMAAFSRSDTEPAERRQFYLYIDEFQNFATKSFIDILCEARKYKLSLILAHQNLSQLPKDLRDSILGNCGIQACFRVNREDAQIMAKEIMSPLYRHTPGWEMTYQMIQELEKHFFYIANRNDQSVAGVETLQLPKPCTLTQEDGKSWNETDFNSLLNIAGIGATYLRNRAELEQGYRQRLAEFAPKEPESFRRPGDQDGKESLS